MYDPLAGRFMSSDPVMQAPFWSQGLNPHSYVFSDPINLTDPSGFISFNDAMATGVKWFAIAGHVAGGALAFGGLAAGGTAITAAGGAGQVASFVHGSATTWGAATGGYGSAGQGANRPLTFTNEPLPPELQVPDGREANRLMHWANNLLNRYGPKAIEAGKQVYDVAKPHVVRAGARGADLARRYGSQATDAATRLLHAAKASMAQNPAITFGRNANQIEHAFRHTDKLGLSRSDVANAIRSHLPSVTNKIQQGSPLNQVIEVGGKRIQYSAYQFSDGSINVGRIHGVP